MNSFNRIVGIRIQNRLDELEWSQSRLADKLGVSRQIINKIIHGRKNVTLEEIKLIADILDINLEDIVKQVEEEETEDDPIMAFMGQVNRQEAKDGLNKAKQVMDKIIFHRDVKDAQQDLID